MENLQAIVVAKAQIALNMGGCFISLLEEVKRVVPLVSFLFLLVYSKNFFAVKRNCRSMKNPPPPKKKSFTKNAMVDAASTPLFMFYSMHKLIYLTLTELLMGLGKGV